MKWRAAIGLVVVAGAVAGWYAYACETVEPPEGTWRCTLSWVWDNDGVAVPCTAEQSVQCVDSRLSAEGAVSIGAARWSEFIEGTCEARPGELYGRRTEVRTVAQNDAARHFERDILEGAALSSLSAGGKAYLVRVSLRTEDRIEAVNEEGRVISCTRL